MKLTALACNRLWKRSCRKGWQRFLAAGKDLQGSQEAHLLELLRANADTAFGREHGFSGIRSVADYRRQVPLRSWDDFQPWLDRVYRGEQQVLTADPVTLLEPTSGSTRGVKLVPFTRRLHQEFQAGLDPWIYDLFSAEPAVMAGKAWWAVSPNVKIDPPPGCTLPVGFASDAEYLGPVARRCARAIQAVPPEAQREAVIDHQCNTLVHLLEEKNLRLVSVWNPSFFTVLLDRFTSDWRDRVLRQLRPARAREIEAAFARHPETDAGSPWPEIWPRLTVISAWSDGWAATAARELEQLLPQARLQAKGLLATEGLVTIPLRREQDWAQVLSPHSHYFEFLDLEQGAARGAHELESMRDYEVVLSTGGGLYRYRLGDRVRCGGLHHGLPCLQFVGRDEQTVDLTGEKLHACHVARVLEAAGAPERSFLKPKGLSSPAYGLYCVAEPEGSDWVDRVEEGLRENIHYRHARDIGQLGPLQVHALGEQAWEAMLPGRAATRKNPVLVQP